VKKNISKVKPSQDSGSPMKKLEKRSTMTCFICHERGHKSYGCKPRKKKEDKKKTTTSNSHTMKAKEKKKVNKKTSAFNIHTKKINEGKEVTPYLLKKSHVGKVVSYKIGVEEKHWNQPI